MKKIFLSLGAILFGVALQAQSPEENYVKTTTFTVASDEEPSVG